MQTYLAINLTNKKFQVGSTTRPDKRVQEHLKIKDNLPFYNSLRRDPDNFYWIVGVDDGLGDDDRSDEQFYLDFYYGSEWCYNVNPYASSPPSWKNKNHSPQTLARMSVSAEESWRDNHDRRAAVSAKVSGDKNGMAGVKGEAHPSYGITRSDTTLMNCERWMCLKTGHISNRGGLSRWQKARGIDTSLRVKEG